MSESKPFKIKIDTGPNATPWEIADAMFLCLRGFKRAVLATAEADGIYVDGSAIVPLTDQFTGDTPNEKAATDLLRLRLETEEL